VVTILTFNMDRLILIGLISPAEFGLYAVAISFAHILLVLQTAVSAVAFVDLIKLPKAEFALFVHRTFRLLLWMLVILSGVVCLFDKWLLGTVYGAAFVQASPIFRVLLIEASTACIGQVLMQAFLASGAPGIPSFVQLVTLAASAAGMFVLVPFLGAMGAALALAISSSLRLVMLLVALRRIGVGIPNPLPRMSDLTPILAYLQRMKQAEPFVP
jgi:O-antigen/teichoic acid export membrane protein